MIKGQVEEIELSLNDFVIKVLEFSKYLLSQAFFILIAGVLGAILGFLYAFNQKPEYKAELSFVLENDQSDGSAGYAGLASQLGLNVGGNSGGGVFAGENLLELMKSRSLVEKALLSPVVINGQHQTLAEYYINFNKIREGWQSDLRLKNIQFLPDAVRSKFSIEQDSILGSFYKKIVNNHLLVDKKNKLSSIMLIQVSSSDELFSKLFAEELIKEVSFFYIETKTKKTVDNLQILQRQTDSVRRALNGAISGVALSIDANPNANPARQILQAPSQRRSVDVQANQTLLTELVKNLEISKMSLRRETPLIQIIDRPILPLTKTVLSKKTALLIGGIVSGFLMIVFLIIKRIFSGLKIS